jgi:RNA polymerase sigma factor (sigma-70 family)
VPSLSPDLQRTIDAVWRMEWPKLVGALARMARDVGAAEDLAQDAMVAALEQWPRSGVPDKPGAWLMTAARRRAIDVTRRRITTERKHEILGAELDVRNEEEAAALHEALDDDIGDDQLRLLFMACHPTLSTDAQVALTLRLLGGLTTMEIARAFLVPEPTIAQRIVRAKRTLTDQQVAFEVPRGADRVERLDAVLDVIYLVFNEGYSATAGDDWMRPALCEEALRLGRVLAGLAPDEPEVHGLVALMELHASRMRARIGPDGTPILLLDQDRSRWDRLLIGRGLASLRRAVATGGGRGGYSLQAAIASCHATALEASATNWTRIVELYDMLLLEMPSPIVQLNRAVAVSMAVGPEAGLEAVDAIAHEPALRSYHLLPAVRGDLLARLGRTEDAAVAFEHAAALTRNGREQALLRTRAADCRAMSSEPG